MSVRTGFIGVGAMGSPMALNILKAGIPLVVHDVDENKTIEHEKACLLYTSPSPRDKRQSRMPSSA